ncbi:carbamoyltransferase [Tenacibaculum sp. 190524A02b]|uniref:carbamoyltransferase family protein n=1 Tax=Tenacibaculum vairaonense TaxID=3137860 RepID=UPI0031FB1E66
MKTTKAILGINSVYHESSACLVVNGKLVAAIEEERLSRIKHAKEAKIDNPNELPMQAINECLRIGNLTLSDIDEIGFSFEPQRRLDENLKVDDFYEAENWGSKEGEELFYLKLKEVPYQLKELGFKGEFVYIEHAIAHAASTFYPSGFEDAAIVSIDGIGEIESSTIAHGKGSTITKIQQVEYPNSIGFLWEKMAKFLGYSEYDACKVMSIASFGEPEKFMSAYEKFIMLNNDTFFKIDKDIIKFRIEDYTDLEEIFGIPKRSFNDPLLKVHQDIAASLQEITTTIVMNMVQKAYEKTQSKKLCLAGGVALNCVTNRIIFENSKFEDIYIQPAANDAGTALGAALKLYTEGLEGNERITLNHTYLGPSFNNNDIQAAIEAKGLVYREHENIEEIVAELLTEGKVIGWFQGAMEFGPRALGNRSLLADPRDPGMVKKLNSVVKHREDHRPFCPSVLAEDAAEWFNIGKEATAADYMLMAYPVNKNKKENIPAVVHVDGTSRIQKVQKSTNPKYHKLITKFKELTGVPLLLNTSFNDREPIVCTPENAINTFLKTKIDVLVLGNNLMLKEENVHLKSAEQKLSLQGLEA